METVQRFTLFSSKFLSIYSVLYGYNMIKSLKYFSLTMSFALTSPGFQNIFFCKGWTFKKNIGRTRILRWLVQENEENVARAKNCYLKKYNKYILNISLIKDKILLLWLWNILEFEMAQCLLSIFIGPSNINSFHIKI